MSQTRLRLSKQLQLSSSPASVLYTNSDNELTYLAPPGADRILFYDHSGVVINWLDLGPGLQITGTTLDTTSSSGYGTIQEEGSPVGPGNSVINFVGSGITAADAGSGVTSVTINTFLNTLATSGAVNLASHVTGDLPFANLTQIAGLSVLGVTGDSTADVAAITAGTDHQVLRRSGTSLAFGALNLAQSAAVSGVLDETNGGTGQSTITTGDILYGSASNTLGKLAGVATGNALISGGVATAPSWGKIGLTTHVSGTLPIANGGTNVTTYTTGDILYASATNTLSKLGIGTSGYILRVSGSGVPEWVTPLDLGYSTKNAVRVATTTAGTLSTSFENGDTIDGVTLATGNRILIKDQAAPAENGIYVVNASGAPTRAADADAWAELVSAFVWVEEGTTNADTGWLCTVNSGGTLNTTAVTWAQQSGAATITAGAGLTKTGNTIDVITASSSRIVVNANDIDLATTAVTPGSYGSATQVGNFTVDSYGRLTAAGTISISLPSSAITDFSEAVDDRVAALLVEGTGVNLTYNDGANTLTVDVDTLYTANGSISAARTVTLGAAGSITFVDNSTNDNLFIEDGGVSLMNALVTVTDSDFIVTAPASLTVGDTFDLVLTGTTTAVITDSRATTTGLEYNADYSAEFTDRTLVDKEYVDNAVTNASVTITRAYVEGSTASSIDLDANTGVVKDVDGNNVAFTIPTDEAKFKVFKNGQLLMQTGTATTRDYDVNTTTHVLTLEVALSASDILMVEKFN